MGEITLGVVAGSIFQLQTGIAEVNLDAAEATIVADTSAYYVLGYASTNRASISSCCW